MPDYASIIRERAMKEFGYANPKQLAEANATIQSNGSFRGLDYSKNAGPTHLDYMVQLARANVVQRCAQALRYYFANPSIFSQMIDYDRYLSGPTKLGTVVLFLGKTLPADLVKKIGDFILSINADPKKAREEWASANITDMATSIFLYGVGTGRTDILQKAMAWVEDDLETNYLGIQPDFSHHHHTNQLYTHGYGATYQVALIRFGLLLKDTPWALKPSTLTKVHDFLMKGTRFMIRRKWYDPSAFGRNIARPYIPENYAARYVRDANNLKTLLPRNAKAYDDFVAYMNGEEGHDEATANVYFNCSSFMTHHRKGWYTSARGFCRGVAGSECCNDENEVGMWTCFGATWIVKSNPTLSSSDTKVFKTEYSEMFPVFDWTKVPGVTNPSFIVPHFVLYQPSNLAGGVSDGRYGAMFMTYRPWGPDEAPANRDKGINPYRVASSGQKAWFFFDDEWVGLGAGLNFGDGKHNLFTCVNQCRLDGQVVINGQVAPANEDGSKALQNTKAVFHDDTGYYFPSKPDDVRMANRNQTGSWQVLNPTLGDPYKGKITKPVFKLWIDHGKDVKNGSYSYVVVPNANQKQFHDWLVADPIVILQNTTAVQAVAHKKLKITQVVFAKPGQLEYAPGRFIATNAPLVCIINYQKSPAVLHVSNPVGVSMIRDAVAYRAQFVNASVKVTLKANGVLSAKTFSLPTGPSGGKSVAATESDFVRV
jgi:chondroitin AC lyase